MRLSVVQQAREEDLERVRSAYATLSVMDQIVADEAPVTEIWVREAFCALGGGDLDVDAILDGLRGMSFAGWLVVEQDILPRSAARFAQAGPSPTRWTGRRSRAGRARPRSRCR